MAFAARERLLLMITGHFAVAAAGKSVEPRAPLWSLMLATMWLDVVFVPLLLLGVERIETPPEGGYGSSVIHADYTHSLLGALLLSAAFGAIAAWRWQRRVGVILAGVAFSHWLLDLLVHRADLPLLPGDAGGLPRLGLGLWKVPVASIVLEAILLAGGVYLYWRAARRYSGGPDGARGNRITPGLVAAVLAVSGIVVLLFDALGI